MKILKPFLVLLLCFQILSQSCNPASVSNVASLVNLAHSVLNLIDAFAEKSSGFTTKLANVTNLATKSINEGKPIGKVAKFWGNQWGIIHSEFDDLNSTLNDLNQTTYRYFQELENNTARIVDDNIRVDEQNINSNLKIRWDIEYKKAEAELAKLKPMLQKGDDFSRVLDNVAMRETISKSIPNLRMISNQANSLGRKIQSFEKNAKSIFKTY